MLLILKSKRHIGDFLYSTILIKIQILVVTIYVDAFHWLIFLTLHSVWVSFVCIAEANKYFVEYISKAYQALTDPVSRENYEKYGHPDGRQVQLLNVLKLRLSFGLDSLQFYERRSFFAGA